jgi:hypothetical protein
MIKTLAEDDTEETSKIKDDIDAMKTVKAKGSKTVKAAAQN